MNSIINHAAPNVVPGTNFNSQRFQEMFAWISAMTADVARSTMTSNQFGLLIPFDGKAALQLDKKESLLTLRRCSGITPGGKVIGIFEDITPVLEKSISEYHLDPKMQYHIVIEVKTVKRTAFGPSTKELPLRPQFSMPDYQIHVQQIDQTIGHQTNAFPIGLLTYKSGDWELGNYIPPCAQIGAHEVLRDRYRNYIQDLEVILDSHKIFANLMLRQFADPLNRMAKVKHD